MIGPVAGGTRGSCGVTAATVGTRQFGDPRLFAAHGLAAMWDTSRVSSITLNANDVSAIASLVPGSVDLPQATPANQPLFVGAPRYGEFPSIQFTRANADALTRTATNLVAAGPHTLISVQRIRAITGGVYNDILGTGMVDININFGGLRNHLFVGNSDHTFGAPSTTVPEVWSSASNGSGSNSILGMVNAVPQTMSQQTGIFSDLGGVSTVTLGGPGGGATADMDWLFGCIFTTQLPIAVSYRIHKAQAARAGIAA